MRARFSGGADWLIVAAIKAGHHQVPGIADYARVEPLAARNALNRLRRRGKVRRRGNTKHARYFLTKRRKDSVRGKR